MRRRLIGGTFALLLVTGALAHWDPPHSAPPDGFTADAVLVLSGDVGYQRLERAIALFHEGAAPWLVLTGAGVGGDSAATMRERAIQSGVSPNRILMEDVATTTRDNLLLTAPVIRRHGFKTLTLVTNTSHMGRAERVARKAIPEVHWIAVPVPDPGPKLRIYRTRLQEWAKLAYYAVRRWI